MMLCWIYCVWNLLLFTITTISSSNAFAPPQGRHLFSPPSMMNLRRNEKKTAELFSDLNNNNNIQIAADANADAAAAEEEDDECDEMCEDLYIEVQLEGYFDGVKPDSSWNLAWQNFLRQGKTIVDQALVSVGLKEEDLLRPPKCLKLTLSNEAVKETERLRIASGGGVDAHPVSLFLYDVGCAILDELFDERPIQRFWFLETIARIPYFSYVSMLHLYESFGWWRAVELRKVHAAEEWNEMHHLLIMESMGGNAVWSDRFLGYHVAIAYYWFLIVVFLGSPRIAYQFMELLEAHAVDTYGTFVRQNRKRLRQLPAPSIARSYYLTGDLYMFDDFQVSRKPGVRRPPCATLLDVFENICQDEAEHVKTMRACQEYAVNGTQVVSPHMTYRDEMTAAAEQEEKRKKWQEWADMINEKMPGELE